MSNAPIESVVRAYLIFSAPHELILPMLLLFPNTLSQTTGSAPAATCAESEKCEVAVETILPCRCDNARVATSKLSAALCPPKKERADFAISRGLTGYQTC